MTVKDAGYNAMMVVAMLLLFVAAVIIAQTLAVGLIDVGERLLG